MWNPLHLREVCEIISKCFIVLKKKASWKMLGPEFWKWKVLDIGFPRNVDFEPCRFWFFDFFNNAFDLNSFLFFWETFVLNFKTSWCFFKEFVKTKRWVLELKFSKHCLRYSYVNSHSNFLNFCFKLYS